MSLGSRLFKFGMVAGGRPPVYPHMATSHGDVFQYDAKTDAITKLLTLSLGTGEPSECAYSPDGKFLAYCSGSSNPGYYLFKRTSSGYASVTLPGTFSGQAVAVAWSNDGQYLIYGCISGYVRWYKRNADDTFTQLPSVTVPNNRNICAVAISPDNKYIAVSYTVSAFLILYKNTNDSLVNIAVTTAPPSYAEKMIFLDATTLLFPCNNANPTYVYKFDPATDAQTRSAPTAITTQYAYSVGMSKDGTHISIGTLVSGSTYVGLDNYKYDGTNFTKLASADVKPVSRGYGVSFSPDENYLAVADGGAPYVEIYKRVGDTLTKLADLTGLTQASTHDVTFAPAVNV